MKTLQTEIALANVRDSLAVTEQKNRQLIRLVRRLEKERDASLLFGVKSVHKIEPVKPTGKSEATAVVLCSDWHIEETVKSSAVSGLNEYTLEIAKKRAEKFWQTTARMVKIFNRDIPIPQMVLWLGGDFLSGSIHDELLETCSLRPVEAALLAQDWLASGIQYLLNETSCQLLIPCSIGNHSRITKERRISTEAGNSLELFIYHALAKHFANNSRVRFILPEGYHTYLNIYGKIVRFHHGHGINYGGGIGGIFIPAFKAIGQWNKGRVAELDVFG